RLPDEVAIIALSATGAALGRRLRETLPGTRMHSCCDARFHPLGLVPATRIPDSSISARFPPPVRALCPELCTCPVAWRATRKSVDGPVNQTVAFARRRAI